MSEENIPEPIQSMLNETTGEVAPNIAPEYTPVFKMVGDSKIPVSKKRGSMWKARRDMGLRAKQDVIEAWEEALKYYHNDQSGHRTESDGDQAGNKEVARQINDKFSETENIVFANVSAMVPSLYAKNPQIEISVATEDKATKLFARAGEKLVNTLFAMKAAPGVNIKPKARRAVVLALTTNNAWIETGYIKKDASSEQAFADIRRLSEELSNAKDVKEIERIEGELIALEEAVDILRPAGPYLRVIDPRLIVEDPDAEEEDCSDANWMMRCDYIMTSYLRAVFGQKDDKNQYMSIYDPTHVLPANKNNDGDDYEAINSFKLFDKQQDFTKLGYGDEDSFKLAQRTKCWWVWDKVTRRLELYNDKDWTMPIWVWDDPLQLDTFFPYDKLSFHTSPLTKNSKGEVSYYLDQQDAINEINDEERRARLWAKRNLFCNSNFVSEDLAAQIMNGPDGTVKGIKVPEGQKLNEMFFSITPPAFNFPQLFDKSRKLEAIDRISSVQAVMRGAEFKTNTTNGAIETYNSVQSTRLDERTDAVEDFIGSIGWKILQLCARFMDAATVSNIVGFDVSSVWRPIEPHDTMRLSFRVVGGSTSKPTSQEKKKMAVQIGQVLGQFANATPAAAMIVLKVFERAFDEVVITEEDWKFIQESIVMQMQRGSSATPDGAQQQGGMPPELEQILSQLPPEARATAENALANGVPPEEVIREIQANMQEANNVG